MSEEQDKHGLPWLLRRGRVEPHVPGPDLDPAGAVYRLFKNTRNPFVRRVLAPAPSRLTRSSSDLQQLFRFFREDLGYEVSPSNAASATTRRSLQHPAPTPPARPQFQTPRTAVGDVTRLPWMVDEFFADILRRLRADPGEFEAIVADLVELLGDHGIRFRRYEAYSTLADWDDLMDTLTEIARYPAVETFDLFCSALLVYHDLVHPP